jgi:carbonic anhydrase
MDARLDPAVILGLGPGDAHVLRNAGGLVTDDVIRSLAVSQRVLGTEEVVVLHHTGCGMADLDGDALAEALEKETGMKPPFQLVAIGDAVSAVRATVARLHASPFLRASRIRGFVYDVDTAHLEVIDLH